MNVSFSKDERNIAMICHLCGLAGYIGAFGGFVFPFINVIAPLAVWLIKRGESAFVDDQGREAINFQASWSIYWMVAAGPCGSSLQPFPQIC